MTTAELQKLTSASITTKHAFCIVGDKLWKRIKGDYWEQADDDAVMYDKLWGRGVDD